MKTYRSWGRAVITLRMWGHRKCVLYLRTCRLLSWWHVPQHIVSPHLMSPLASRDASTGFGPNSGNGLAVTLLSCTLLGQTGGCTDSANLSNAEHIKWVFFSHSRWMVSDTVLWLCECQKQFHSFLPRPVSSFHKPFYKVFLGVVQFFGQHFRNCPTRKKAPISIIKRLHITISKWIFILRVAFGKAVGPD